MKSKTRSSLRNGRFLLAICIGSGLPTILFAQTTSSSDSWQPRWIPSGQIPASPWDRPTSTTTTAQPSTTKVPSHGSSIDLPRSASPEPHKTIHQPTSSVNPNRFPLSSHRSSNSTKFIEQPTNSDRPWEQIPKRGQTVQFNADQPIVDLGWPIPTDTMVSLQSTDAATGRDLPLEAHRDQPSGSSQGLRRSARNPEPTSNEVGQANAVDYLSSTPSSVVGVVAIPAASNIYTEESEVGMMNTFVPSDELNHSHVVPASNADNDSAIARMKLASQVSRELLSDSQPPLGMAPLPVEPPTGWKSIEQELRDRMSKCDELLRRNAVLSARDEVLTGLRVLFRAIDLRAGDWTSEPALDQALAAFAEEADFQQSLLSPTHAQSAARIVAGHTTQALKQVDLNGVSPELAAQHYRSYARQQLAKASQGHPWAADLIYALGKTYERRAESGTEDAVMLRNQAVACYAAALDVVPDHADGANQLGYALLKLDRVDEAQSILSQVVQDHPSAEIWRNLAEVHRRRGQAEQTAFALEQVATFTQSKQPRGVPEVLQIDPKTFAGISPNQYTNQGSTNSPHVATATAGKAIVPAKNSSWFSRLLR